MLLFFSLTWVTGANVHEYKLTSVKCDVGTGSISDFMRWGMCSIHFSSNSCFSFMWPHNQASFVSSATHLSFICSLPLPRFARSKVLLECSYGVRLVGWRCNLISKSGNKLLSQLKRQLLSFLLNRESALNKAQISVQMLHSLGEPTRVRSGCARCHNNRNTVVSGLLQRAKLHVLLSLEEESFICRCSAPALAEAQQASRRKHCWH